jgi:hypothetical protein
MTCFPVTMTRYRRHLVYLLGEPVLSEVSPRLIEAFPPRVKDWPRAADGQPMTAFQPIVRTSNTWLHLAGAADYTGASRAELVDAIEHGELDAQGQQVRMHDVEAWLERRLAIAV